MMCEIPSNAILADEFLKRFDGFSIGSNDLTQLTLGLDRDSADRAPFDERDPAVKAPSTAPSKSVRKGKYVGSAGRALRLSRFRHVAPGRGHRQHFLANDTVVETRIFSPGNFSRPAEPKYSAIVPQGHPRLRTSRAMVSAFHSSFARCPTLTGSLRTAARRARSARAGCGPSFSAPARRAPPSSR
jgi:hypothetical protein